MRKDEMLSYLPPHWGKSVVVDQIMGTEGIEFDGILAANEDIRAQLDIDRATWGLDIYERELGLQTDISKSLPDRRSVIKSKLRGSGKADAELVKVVVDAYTNGDVEAAFANGVIKITFTSVYGVPSNIADVEKAIDEIKPAHLSFEFVYKYNTYQALSAFTNGHLSAFKHASLREGVII